VSGKIRIEDQWLKWDEGEEVLRDNEGKIWREEEKGKKGKEVRIKKEERKKEGKREKEHGEKWRIVFWNVAGPRI